jgi:hypothetical protein
VVVDFKKGRLANGAPVGCEEHPYGWVSERDDHDFASVPSLERRWITFVVDFAECRVFYCRF